MLMKTVVLIEVGNDGHRVAYMRHFCVTLLNKGHKVLCLIPKTEPIKNYIDKHFPKLKNNIKYHDYPYKWKISFLPMFISVRLNILFNLFQIKRIIANFEKQVQQKVDLTFFNYVDVFLISKVPLLIFNYFLNRKWGGLLIHSGMYRQFPSLLEKKSNLHSSDYIFNSKKCIALAVHDEGIIAKLKNRLHSEVILFPEIADTTEPDYSNKIYQEIKTKAKGRIVIGTIGLEYHKCGYEFLQLSKMADKNKFFFVFAGVYNEYVKKHYNNREIEAFEHLITNPPENCHISLGHINEGKDYNSIFCSFDIVYLIYKDFYNASNRLTKAAYFNKLVLATNTGCISEDVKKYLLGETTTPNNIEEHIKKLYKLEKILQKKIYDRHQEYYKKHELAVLERQFDFLINKTI